MQVLIETHSLEKIIDWCGVWQIRFLFTLERFYTGATSALIELGTKEACGDAETIVVRISTHVDTATFRDQRHAHHEWLREVSPELYIHITVNRMSHGDLPGCPGPHDHTASMEDADDSPQHTMGKEVDAATLLTCNTCTGTGHPDGNWLQLNITIGGRDRSSLVCPRCQAFIVEAIKKKNNSTPEVKIITCYECGDTATEHVEGWRHTRNPDAGVDMVRHYCPECRHGDES